MRSAHIVYCIFRRFLGYDKYCSASSMFVENRTDGFNARICKLVHGFRERLQISENSLIKTVINSSAWRSSRLLNLWEKYLYLPWIMMSNAPMLWYDHAMFFLHLFIIFCDVVYYVSIHFSPCFTLVIINEMMMFCACGRPMGHLFSPLFICHFPLFSVNYFCSIHFIWDPCLYAYLCTYYGSLQ